MAKTVYNREEIAKSLLERTKQQADESGKKASYLKLDSVKNIKFAKLDKRDAHFMDIIPYQAGKYDPKRKEGLWTYVLSVLVHKDIPQGGVVSNQERISVVCPSNYGESCPICNHRMQLIQEGADEDLIKKLLPKKRELYNVLICSTEEEMNKGVQLLEISWHFMGRFVEPLLRKPIRPGQKIDVDPIINIAAPDETGKTIVFSVGEKSVPGFNRPCPEFTGHKLEARDYSVVDYLPQAHCLDELLDIKTYEEIYTMYWGVSAGEAEEVDKADDSTMDVSEAESINFDQETSDDNTERVRPKKPAAKATTPASPKKQKKAPKKNEESQTEQDDSLDISNMDHDQLVALVVQNELLSEDDISNFDDSDLKFLLEDYYSK